MKKRQLAIAKDDILKTLYGFSGLDYPVISLDKISNSLEGKKYGNNEIKDLLVEISKSDYSYVITVFHAEPFGINQASSNSFTKGFLESGGFTSIYDDEQTKASLEDARARDESELMGKSNRYYWTPHWISALSAVIALISLFYSMKGSEVEHQVSKEQFNNKIQQLEYNQKQLELQYREDNQKLQDQLHKANEWIDMLEENDAPEKLKKASV